MGRDMKLTASDGHACGAYKAEPSRLQRGGVVVLQEIFGVNAHIRSICDRLADAGYAALAPALYDRSSRQDVQLGYAEEDVATGRKLREEFSWDDSMLDVQAAARELRRSAPRVAALGFCWGGTMAFLAAARAGVEASVVYYGGQIVPYVDERVDCPLLMHFGRNDHAIPVEDVERIAAAHPKATVHLYDAGHGFACDQRAAYHEASASLAWQRTLDFLWERLGV